MSDAKKLVRYVRNADDRATGALTFYDDDRPDLAIGAAGYVTDEELARAAAYGVVLEPIDESRAQELGIELPAAPERPLDELSSKELEEIADAESIDLGGARTNAAKVERIQQARSGGSAEGEASLPATATTGPGAPVAPSESAGSGTTTSVSTAGSGPAT